MSTMEVSQGWISRRIVLFAVVSSPGWLFACWVVLNFFLRPSDFGMDLSAYYGAATAFATGANPYASPVNYVPGGTPGPVFVLPPLTLYGFQFLAQLDFGVAYYLWLVMQLMVLAALITVWYRYFLERHDSPLVIIFLVFAFDSTTIISLHTGNIATLEQLGLWLGFLALLQGRTLLFCLLITLVSQLKLQPVLFLLLLLIVPDRPNWWALFASGAGFGVLFSTNVLLHPALTQDFARVAGALDERGALNPSTLALIRDLTGSPVGQDVLGISAASGPWYYGAVALISLVTLGAVLWYKRRVPRPDLMMLLGVFCAAFALVAPRFKSYTYMLLLVPTWNILMASTSRTLRALAIGLVLLSSNYIRDLVIYVTGLDFGYWSLLAAVSIWFLYVVELLLDSAPDPCSLRVRHAALAGSD